MNKRVFKDEFYENFPKIENIEFKPSEEKIEEVAEDPKLFTKGTE